MYFLRYIWQPKCVEDNFWGQNRKMSLYVRIGFVDDHELFLRSICNSFNAFSERFWTKGFVSGVELLATIKDRNNFDVFIIDIAMKEINGLALIDIIRSKGIDTPIILISGIDNALSGEDPNCKPSTPIGLIEHIA
jgi:ActR/RegA family two-component response regulator